MAAGDQTTFTLAEWSFQSASYAPTGANILSSGTPTPVTFSMSSIAVDAARQSNKVDLGANRPLWLDVNVAVEYFAAVAAEGLVQFFFAPSASSVAANGNPGRASGADGVYTGDGGGTVDQSVLQMDQIGSLITTDLQGVQIAYIGGFAPRFRYGSLIAVNKSSQVVCGTNDIQSAVLMYGTIQNVE